MAKFRIDDLLPILGILGEMFAKSSKGKQFFGTFTEILSYHDLVEDTRRKFNVAAQAGGGVTLTAEEVASLNSMFSQLDVLLDKVKARL